MTRIFGHHIFLQWRKTNPCASSTHQKHVPKILQKKTKTDQTHIWTNVALRQNYSSRRQPMSRCPVPAHTHHNSSSGKHLPRSIDNQNFDKKPPTETKISFTHRQGHPKNKAKTVAPTCHAVLIVQCKVVESHLAARAKCMHWWSFKPTYNRPAWYEKYTSGKHKYVHTLFKDMQEQG